jgi:hypothetical protein
VIDDPAHKKYLLPNSYCLGPKKHEYGELFAPKFHVKDKPGDIIDESTGNPRRYGRLGKWIIEAGEQVSEGADLMTFRVYDPSLVHPKKNPNGRFPPSYPSPEFKDDQTKKNNEKAKIEEAMSSFDGEWIDDNTDEEEEEDLEEAVLGESSPVGYLLLSASESVLCAWFFGVRMPCHSFDTQEESSPFLRVLSGCLSFQMSFTQTGRKLLSGWETTTKSSQHDRKS